MLWKATFCEGPYRSLSELYGPQLELFILEIRPHILRIIIGLKITLEEKAKTETLHVKSSKTIYEFI